MRTDTTRIARRSPRPIPAHTARLLQRVAATAMVMVASAGRHFTIMANDGSVAEVVGEERPTPST